MTMIAVAGGKGSAGATTLAVALAAHASEHGNALLVEADPAGGDMAARCGVSLDPGLLSLAASGRRGLDRSIIERHAQLLPFGVLALIGPTSDEQATTTLTAIGAALGRALESALSPVFIDVGRWHARSPATELVRSSSIALLVFRPTIEGVEHARSQLASLSREAARVAAVSIGERPYPPTEVRAALEVEELYVIAHDPRAARVVSTGTRPDRWLRRSPLLRSSRALAERLLDADEEVAVAR